ncbi:hypothetical protein [Nocardia donostiensis]|uniref:Secreted protein n=1 Tax=Nocardia donostiensis TaxID=1538463 RepID=A0A1V2TH35_9NOCA|nr:hypothetical protein [Nocardia donostiensis]ONM48691.1 hypothetical protein B0T46_11730 [Nocardia donostiensis]OQS16881.1 hypothetical protein B0T36_04405 [Nocardia donostiensis]OQS17757.1 hypothetical protein B0T44_23015 [Nocardia donostiensis]
MTKALVKAATVLAAAALMPILSTAAAQADPGTVYFRAGSTNCAISGNGTVGCDFHQPTRVDYSFLPFLIPVSDLVIDQPWLPAHPTFGSGAAHTLPGGNPDISSVKTADGTWGPIVEHAGARCEVGFHGSFTCQAKGRGFTSIGGTISA